MPFSVSLGSPNTHEEKMQFSFHLRQCRVSNGTRDSVYRYYCTVKKGCILELQYTAKPIPITRPTVYGIPQYRKKQNSVIALYRVPVLRYTVISVYGILQHRNVGNDEYRSQWNYVYYTEISGFVPVQTSYKLSIPLETLVLSFNCSILLSTNPQQLTFLFQIC